MGEGDDTAKYIPMTESTTYIMLSLLKPLHGYGVMQKVKQISEGTVEVGPGTLYGAFSSLEKEGLIYKVGEEGRRKTYTLTSKGKRVLLRQIHRLETMARAGAKHKNKLR